MTFSYTCFGTTLAHAPLLLPAASIDSPNDVTEILRDVIQSGYSPALTSSSPFFFHRLAPSRSCRLARSLPSPSYPTPHRCLVVLLSLFVARHPYVFLPRGCARPHAVYVSSTITFAFELPVLRVVISIFCYSYVA